MRTFFFLVVIVSLAIVKPSYAQTEQLSLDKAIELATQNNKTLHIAKAEVDIANAQASQANALFLPQLSVSTTYSYTDRPLEAFGSKLQQSIITQEDFNPALLNDPDGLSNFSTDISIQQPLINPSGWYQRNAAKWVAKATKQGFIRQQEAMQMQVKNAYWGVLVAQEAVQVLEEAKATALAHLELAENLEKQGLVHKSDVLAAEVYVSTTNNQLRNATKQLKDHKANLKHIVGLDLETEVTLTDELSQEVLVSYDSPVTTLVQNRADIQAQKYGLEAQQNMTKSSVADYLPSINAFGSYQWNQEELFKDGGNGVVVGVQAKWDILKGSTRANKVKEQKAALRKATYAYEDYMVQQQIELEKAQRMLDLTVEQVNTAHQDVERMEEVVRIKQNRFEQGLERSTDLRAEETQLASKKLEYLQQLFAYHSTQAYVNFLSK